MGYGESQQDAERTPRPENVPADLVHDLDHWNGPDYLADPIGFWDDLRGPYRVFWSPFHGGFWCLTRYEDIHEAFQRADLFSSRITNIPGREVRLLPITLDPPEHTTYRRLLNLPFSPARIALLMDKITDRSNALIDDVIDRGEFEFMDTFAKALPTGIFCDLLGLPHDEVKKFLEWNYIILHVHGDAEGQERQRIANEELGTYLGDLVAERTSRPHDDLVSALIPLEIDGRPITRDEAVSMTYLLFLAGLDTVTSALGWCWKFLAEHPSHRQQILSNPAIIPKAVEELLRYHAFVEDSRTVTRDVEFAGVMMKEGDRVMLPTSSACRDEAEFPDALTVDFEREPNRHIAFASGPHRCLGSHLARAELHIAMELWHQRVPDYELGQGEIRYHGGAVVGPDCLRLTITGVPA
jgi:cytochrome P450